ncbi:MAG TPA: hypothetical protein VIY69_19170 [Candidatus Acidoferrales bacterium]
MREITIFYAWQSDTPEEFNRHLIRISLDEAAKRISADASLNVEIVIDAGTEGVLGQPPVTDTILRKISDCDIFVPDLTFVARTEGGKFITNPNVMTEYGYALRAKGYGAMIAVMNTAFGPPEQLPFDLGHVRHPTQYRVERTATDGERRKVRQKLSETLEEILRLHVIGTQPEAPPPAPFPKAEPKDGPARFRPSNEPVGHRWDRFPTPNANKPTFMETGPAIWLRLMPMLDPGRKWETYELEEHALQTGYLNLAPFIDNPIFKLRAHDGIGICSLLGPDEPTTTSVAFAFETGEVWGIDTTFLQYSPNAIPFLEPYFGQRLQSYARFLAMLGLQAPYTWICGITGAAGRQLEYPVQPGRARIPGWPMTQCLTDTIVEEGTYDGKQDPGSALLPFFKAVFAKCGLPRPDYLSNLPTTGVR